MVNNGLDSRLGPTRAAQGTDTGIGKGRALR